MPVDMLLMRRHGGRGTAQLGEEHRGGGLRWCRSTSGVRVWCGALGALTWSLLILAQAAKSLTSILKPLEVLTRSSSAAQYPARPGSPTAARSAQQAMDGAATVAEGAAAAAAPQATQDAPMQALP
jgi:hypothetical protein